MVPNEIELASISGIKIEKDEDVFFVSKALLEMGVRDLIVTSGERGCIHFDQNGSKAYGARKVKAVDTTAAGDSFVGTLTAMLSERKHLNESISYAISASALTVTKEGAQISMPNRKDADDFVKSN